MLTNPDALSKRESQVVRGGLASEASLLSSCVPSVPRSREAWTHCPDTATHPANGLAHVPRHKHGHKFTNNPPRPENFPPATIKPRYFSSRLKRSSVERQLKLCSSLPGASYRNKIPTTQEAPP